MKSKINRNSNIEILRIIAILMIVISHYSTHNGIDNYSLNIGINRYLLEIMTLGNIGAIIFILIMGYYCINKNPVFKFQKLLSMFLQVLFYSVIIYLLFVLIGMEKFSLFELIKCFFPITFKQYWFISAYLLLYIFSPYLNKLLNALMKNEHLLLITIGLLLFSILHMFTGQDYYGNELIQFILFYAIGAYFGKYRSNIFTNKNICKFGLLISIIIMAASIYIFDLFGLHYEVFGKHSTFLMNRTSPFAIMFSICIFNLFVNKNEINNNIVNKISSCVLGVYLISDHPTMRKYLWSTFFKAQSYITSNVLVFHMLFCVIITFITALIIEYIYKITIGKGIDAIFGNVDEKIKKTKIYSKLNCI